VGRLPESQTEIALKPVRPAMTHQMRNVLIALSPILLLGTILVLWINSTGWIPFSLGVIEHNLTHYEQAIDYFDWAIKSNPKWADAYDYRARARTGLDTATETDFELAIKDASKAIELNPTEASYYETRAAAYESAEKYKEAIADYTHRLNMTPAVSNTDSAIAKSLMSALSPEQNLLESRASLYEKLGDWTNARADRQKLIDQYSREIDDLARNESATDFARRKGKTVAAEKPDQYHSPYQDRAEQYVKIGEFNPALSDYTSALNYLSELSAGPVYSARADLQARLGHDQQAIYDYGKAIKLMIANGAPDRNSDDADQLAASYFGRAKLYIKKKDYFKALADCDKLVELDAQDKYRACRASVFDKLGQHEQASAERKEVIDPYNKAIKEEATDSTYNDRGIAYEDLGQYKEALQDYLAALRLAPTESIYMSNCATIYGRLGDYEKAISLFSQAAQSDKSRSNKACFYAADAQEQTLAGRPQEAINLANQALQYDASNPVAYHWRSEAEKMLGKFDPARKDDNLAVRFDYESDD
jgi:tetratricopeptide (TPR) repeat protein